MVSGSKDGIFIRDAFYRCINGFQSDLFFRPWSNTSDERNVLMES